MSDTVGRKPVILCGLFGLAITMYIFGIATTFLGLIIRLDIPLRNLKYTQLSFFSRGLMGALSELLSVVPRISNSDLDFRREYRCHQKVGSIFF